MTSDQPTLPLTCDLETLEQRLFECPDVDGAMLLSELDGYLAGLLVSPHPTAQDIWLREIWGGGGYVARAGGVDVGDAPLDEDVPPEVMIPYLVETLYRCQNGLPRIAMETPWDGGMQPVLRPKIGRNSHCPCGSGKKFKNCCGAS